MATAAVLLVSGVALAAFPATSVARNKPDLAADASVVSTVEAPHGLSHVVVNSSGVANFEVVSETRNTGKATADAPPSTTRLVLNGPGQDKAIKLKPQKVSKLKPTHHETDTIHESAKLPLGTWRLKACADGPDDIDERNEDNNCSTSLPFTAIPRVWTINVFFLRRVTSNGPVEQRYQAVENGGDPNPTFRYVGIRPTPELGDAFYYAPEGDILGSYSGSVPTSSGESCKVTGGGQIPAVESYLAFSPQPKPLYYAQWWPGVGPKHPVTNHCPGYTVTYQVPYGAPRTGIGTGEAAASPWHVSQEGITGINKPTSPGFSEIVNHWQFIADL